MREDATVPLLVDEQRRDVMKAPDEVSAMLWLKALGWGSKRIAAELGCSRNTVRHWLARAIGGAVRGHPGRRSWMAYRSGCANVFVSMLATPMWFARSWRERRIS